MTFAIGNGEFLRALFGLFITHKKLLAVFKELLVCDFLALGEDGIDAALRDDERTCVFQRLHC